MQVRTSAPSWHTIELNGNKIPKPAAQERKASIDALAFRGSHTDYLFSKPEDFDLLRSDGTGLKFGKKLTKFVLGFFEFIKQNLFQKADISEGINIKVTKNEEEFDPLVAMGFKVSPRHERAQQTGNQNVLTLVEKITLPDVNRPEAGAEVPREIRLLGEGEPLVSAKIRETSFKSKDNDSMERKGLELQIRTK